VVGGPVAVVVAGCGDRIRAEPPADEIVSDWEGVFLAIEWRTASPAF
jgi:hypothetical protein